ncbi:MAG TPA: OsmC family protein [Gemmatimonadales bacterium]|nr:OsmC family protein [Gemmatimonadales bacterium]
MSTHSARISWQQRPGDQFTASRYSRSHHWSFDGGLEIPASASPDLVRPPWSDPAAIDPEEAFVASLASCHMLWFLGLAAEQGFSVASYVDDAAGTLGRNAAGRLAITAVTLAPRVRFSNDTRPTEAEFMALHHLAHERCFLAASVTSVVTCVPAMDTA